MRLVVDTGVFSASLTARRRRPALEGYVTRLVGNQLFLAVQTVAELRFGALVAGWGSERLERLESSVAATGVVPVTDELIDNVARLRFEARRAAHPIADRSHHADLWIAASAIHIDAPLLTADAIFSDVPGLRLG